jgi:hypothetical protein
LLRRSGYAMAKKGGNYFDFSTFTFLINRNVH